MIGQKINRLGNMAAYNPGGAEEPGTEGRDEGYLYWAGRLSHNGNSIFEGQDGTGLYRRLYFTAGCPTLSSFISQTPLNPVITEFEELFRSGGPCNP